MRPYGHTHPTYANGLQLAIHDGRHTLVIDYSAQLYVDGAYAQYSAQLMVDCIHTIDSIVLMDDDGGETEFESIGHAAESPHVTLTEDAIEDMLLQHATNRIDENAFDCAEVFL